MHLNPAIVVKDIHIMVKYVKYQNQNHMMMFMDYITKKSVLVNVDIADDNC